MPNVLFIAGAHRSGSTVFEKFLASHANTVTLGEVRQLWQMGFEENCLCACGKPFLDCPFWAAVSARLMGSGEGPGSVAVRALSARVDRIRFAPRLRYPRMMGTGSRNDLAEVRRLLACLYEAVEELADSRLVLDSSKSPVYGRLLSGVEGMNIAYVNLVRDPRGVAFSLQQRKRRPEVTDHEAFLPRLTARSAALDWLTQVTLARWLTSRLPNRSITLRYEDIVRWPDRAKQRIDHLLATNSMPPLGKAQPVPDRDLYHSVSGNPLRFADQGPVQWRLDDRWQSDLSPRDRAVVTALTGPYLRWYRSIPSLGSPN